MTDRRIQGLASLDTLSFWENGLLPVVAQDVETGKVLMVAFANREALEQTLATGQMHYWSRSRNEIWHKGATSGNFQDLISLHADCDSDTLLARVRPQGPSCHTGEETCFGILDLVDPIPEGGESTRPTEPDLPVAERTLPGLWATLEQRAKSRPDGSYTVRLLDDENLRLKKLGEEVAELILALSRQDEARMAPEGADLVYHILVALMASGVTLEELLAELENRKA
jgi:phosphoribosyl-ATP pyrophosphohydrolase/phosphoribosyl-AMP cyclohydrolase